MEAEVNVLHRKNQNRTQHRTNAARSVLACSISQCCMLWRIP
jgi:hypothetical protein